MSDRIRNLVRMASSYLAGLSAGEVTPSSIRDVLVQLSELPIFRALEAQELEMAARTLEEQFSVTMTEGVGLDDRSHTPWVAARRVDVEWFYWNRYRDHLADAGWPREVLSVMDRDTDEVLDLLQDPESEGPWDRRGMVIGHVQSGKTANYLGLIAKAADAGYRVIVVVAGIHENLRSQTQSRIDHGFLGWDTGQGLQRRGMVRVGVGKLDGRRTPASFTTSRRDFHRGTADQVNIPLANMLEPAVFVVKKHPSTLDNLINWLEAQEVRDSPLLVIDDEADNASINIKYQKDQISRINDQIRKLLTLFPRSGFIGYTATPFANIFIDPDSEDEMRQSDLFPRHFIYALDRPSNYFGANEVFSPMSDVDEGDGGPHVRFIKDNEDTLPIVHRKELNPDQLPPSMRRALATFIVASAIRNLRGDFRAHRSMLINVSVYTDVQTRVALRVREMLQEFRNALRVHGGRGATDARASPVVRELYSAWNDEYRSAAEWDSVFPHLLEAVGPMNVIEINSRSPDRLQYSAHPDGASVIAVGGYSLSRGMTLEGLIVSYFLRNSRMYDTLMQMARWFGYRSRYEDLCRIWMPRMAAEWYAHIAESIEELTADIREMRARGATPLDFGLRVRSHPDALMATSRVKRGAGTEVVFTLDLARKFIETSHLPADNGVLGRNLDAARTLLQEIAVDHNRPQRAERWPRPDAGYLLRGVHCEQILRFLRHFTSHTHSDLISGEPLVEYIEARADLELREWDVLLPSVSQGSDEAQDLGGFPIRRQVRTVPKEERAPGVLKLSSRYRVAGRGAEKAGVDPGAAEEVEAAFRSKHPEATFPDWIYRPVRERPLLILHLIKVEGAPLELDPVGVVAWSISFPTTQLPGQPVTYVVTPTWLREQGRLEMGDEFTDD